MKFSCLAVLAALTLTPAALVRAQAPAIQPGITTAPVDTPAPAAPAAVPEKPASHRIGFYTDFNADDQLYSNIYTTPPAGSNNSNSAWLYGATAGVYADFFHPKYVGKYTSKYHLALGGDARVELVRSPYYVRNSAIFGMRLSTQKGRVTPYAQGGAGIARTQQPFGSAYKLYKYNPEWRAAVGVDYRLKKHIDWRVVEFGGGSLLNYNYTNTPNATNKIFTLATGLVIRAF